MKKKRRTYIEPKKQKGKKGRILAVCHLDMIFFVSFLSLLSFFAPHPANAPTKTAPVSANANAFFNVPFLILSPHTLSIIFCYLYCIVSTD